VHVPHIINEVVIKDFLFPGSCFPSTQRCKSPQTPPLFPPSPPPLSPLLQSVGFLKVGATCNLESRRPTILICMNTNDFLSQGSLGSLDIFGVFERMLLV
jgi:hypothetical protein